MLSNCFRCLECEPGSSDSLYFGHVYGWSQWSLCQSELTPVWVLEMRSTVPTCVVCLATEQVCQYRSVSREWVESYCRGPDVKDREMVKKKSHWVYSSVQKLKKFFRCKIGYSDILFILMSVQTCMHFFPVLKCLIAFKLQGTLQHGSSEHLASLTWWFTKFDVHSCIAKVSKAHVPT